jgi:hypothetical protein
MSQFSPQEKTLRSTGHAYDQKAQVLGLAGNPYFSPAELPFAANL